MLYNDETPLGISAITMGPMCVARVDPSPLAVAAGLLPALDGGLISVDGGETLRALPGWLGARALLLHGAALRDEVATALAAGAPLPTASNNIRPWLARQNQRFFDRLLVNAALTGIQHYVQRGVANPLVEAVRVRWPNPLPSAEGLLGQPDLASELIMTQTIVWAAATPAALPLVHDGGRLAAVLADALELVLGLMPTVTGLPVLSSGPRTALGLLEQFTGRAAPPDFSLRLSQVRQLVLIPGAGLGPQVLPWQRDDVLVLWADPYAVVPAPQATAETPPAAAATSPETRSALLRLLSDPTASAVLEHLALEGPLPAHRLATALAVHPSTMSRQLKRLVEAGLLKPVADGTRVVYHAKWSALAPVQAWVDRLAAL